MVFFLAHTVFELDLQAAIDTASFHTDHFPSSFYPRQILPRSLSIEARFDPAVVAELRKDPEAETYQFVLRAVRDDAVHVDLALNARAEALELRLREVTHQAEAAKKAYDEELERTRKEAAERIRRAEEQGAESARQAEHARTELAQLYGTRVMRAARIPRAVYGAVRDRAR